MQNFWWNRKFYHGNEEPDSFRLYRTEEKQKKTEETLAALSEAQTALDRVLGTHQAAILEHAGLLTDLTEISEKLAANIRALEENICEAENELVTQKETTDSLQKQLETMETTCADRAAEQENRLILQEEKLAALEEKQKYCVTYMNNNCRVGGIAYSGEGAAMQVRANTPGGAITLYSDSVDPVSYWVECGNATTLQLPPGDGAIYGRVSSVAVTEGRLKTLDLSGMGELSSLTLSYGNYSVVLPPYPQLSDLTVIGVSGSTLNLKKQTGLGFLDMRNNTIKVEFPDSLPYLHLVYLDGEYASDEEFLRKLLPDHSGEVVPGMISLEGATPPSWLADINWEVIG